MVVVINDVDEELVYQVSFCRNSNEISSYKGVACESQQSNHRSDCMGQFLVLFSSEQYFIRDGAHTGLKQMT